MRIARLGALVFLLGLCPVFSVSAATLYMDPGQSELNRADVMKLALRLDTDEGECINSIDATINYTDNIDPIDTSRGDSIFSVWLEEPKIDKTNRTITFAAGIPNGYCGRIIGDPRLTNNIIEIAFSSPGLRIGTPESGDVAQITYGEQTRVLLNDGFGTDAELRTFGSEIILSKRAGNRQINEWTEEIADDDIPPNEFSIKLERTPNAFGNRYFISFNTSDKQSGIDYYEVIEESIEDQHLFGWGASDAPWVRSQSPYVLSDQSLNSIIRVRAYDKAGNEYIASLVPEESIRTMSNQAKIMVAVIATGIILFLVSGLAFWWLTRRKSDDEEWIEEDSDSAEIDDEEEYEDEDEEEVLADEELEDDK